MPHLAVRPATLLLGLIVASSACRDEPANAPAALSTAATHEQPPESEQVQQLAGVSHLPAPANGQALAAAMRRHYPGQFAGLRPRTAVLVDVDVDASGIVQDVRVVDRAGMDESGHVRAVVRQKVPGTNQVVERELDAAYDPAFGPAAQAALREVRFNPAIRDGQPVPFTLRMTVEFTNPAARA